MSENIQTNDDPKADGSELVPSSCSERSPETDTEGNIYYKALDEMMIVACIGTADGCKTVADVRRKIEELIQWNLDVEKYFQNKPL